MPWTNENIRQLMGLLTEIKDSLKSEKVDSPVLHTDNRPIYDTCGNLLGYLPPDRTEKPKHKGGRPKGSKNVKRTGKR